MKKADLEQQLETMKSALEHVIKERDKFMKLYDDTLKSLEHVKEEYDYQMFKERNGKNLERFIKEYISEHVQVKSTCNEANYIDTMVIIDNDVVQTNTGEVSVSHLTDYDKCY